MTPAPISRRHAITLGALGATAVASGVTGWMASSRGPGSGDWSDAADTGAELTQPTRLDSRDGRLQVQLTAAAGARLIGRETHALGYNGSLPGPTLKVHPGDELAVRLVNQLDQPTNLHTHGLRVSPLGNSDNPFLRVDPGASLDYSIRIPPDHPTGTFWYHPHHHGVVADQIFGGLAGALLVDPAPGQQPEFAVAADRVLLVTDITLTGDGRVARPSAMERAMGREGQLVLVNGQHQPAIAAAPGALQRWRIINGCVSRVLVVGLQGHDLLHIAQDGSYLPRPARTGQLMLAPGNRADVIVHPAAPGRFELITEPFQRGGMGMMGGGTDSSEPVTLATMTVDGPPASAAPLPASVPVEARPAGPVVAQRQIAFQMGMGMGMGGGGMTFTIDGRIFDPTRDDQSTTLGSVEDWTVTNTSTLAHPFHLHVWPFTVLASSDNTPPLGVPQDVVLIPPQGWVRLRIAFTRFAGRSVYHCHILDHEDAGMMATVNVHG
ncbi:multicopper oxidase family protein [Mycolicibacterium gilvum]|uniref:multicopper oxidase family protein n=1 Tax=Mycolicibacterium gilvum TaxID=1804 RepID=UPI000C1B09DB